MVDTTAIKAVTLGDMVSIVANRGGIASAIQDRDVNFIKGSLNEWNQKISGERSWPWRSFDRDFVFDRPLTTGTASVTFGSREVSLSTLTPDDTYIGRTFKVSNKPELYRIIGFEVAGASKKIFLSNTYVGDTGSALSFKIFQYEFALPPDCDSINQIYIDEGYTSAYTSEGQIDEISPQEFNRMLSSGADIADRPYFYCRDGKISSESLPPLDVMILDYDFLAGEQYDKIDRVRIFPIDPSKTRLIHLSYNKHVDNMSADSDEPQMDVDDRWILVQFALSDWHDARGNATLSQNAFNKAMSRLKDMRNEHQKSSSKPKFKVDARRYQRVRSFVNSRLDKFLAARANEY